MEKKTFYSFEDPKGNTVQASQYEARGGDVAFHVEVTREGAVVDNYTLYGYQAVQHTAKERKWKEVQV